MDPTPLIFPELWSRVFHGFLRSFGGRKVWLFLKKPCIPVHICKELYHIHFACMHRNNISWNSAAVKPDYEGKWCHTLHEYLVFLYSLFVPNLLPCRKVINVWVFFWKIGTCVTKTYELFWKYMNWRYSSSCSSSKTFLEFYTRNQDSTVQLCSYYSSWTSTCPRLPALFPVWTSLGATSRRTRPVFIETDMQWVLFEFFYEQKTIKYFSCLPSYTCKSSKVMTILMAKHAKYAWVSLYLEYVHHGW